MSEGSFEIVALQKSAFKNVSLFFFFFVSFAAANNKSSLSANFVAAVVVVAGRFLWLLIFRHLQLCRNANDEHIHAHTHIYARTPAASRTAKYRTPKSVLATFQAELCQRGK